MIHIEKLEELAKDNDLLLSDNLINFANDVINLEKNKEDDEE
tara:strand:- start:42 stop:167 length:126 start_codon:yes stop_codon:yes gene_type:complete